MRNYAPIERGARDIARGFSTGNKGDRLASVLALARDRNASAALKEDRLANKVPGQRRFVAGATGLRNDQAEELIAAMMGDGFPQGEAEGPPTVDHAYPTVEQVPNWVTPEVTQNYNQAQQVMGLNDLATGDSKANNLVKVLMALKQQQLQKDMIADDPTPQNVGAVVSALEGKPINNATSSGIVYDQFAPPGPENMDSSAMIQKAIIDARGSGGGKPTTANKKYNEMLSLGVPEEVAKGVSYGLFKQVKDPATDGIILINISTGQPVGRFVQKDPANISSPFVWESLVGEKNKGLENDPDGIRNLLLK